mmetsp:Transcript_114583/g.364186  ORF Transcript_114583/g.364186 Transcript_114583/m.364186 type:complete len:87 (-) Transcript_114583:622-882(-)
MADSLGMVFHGNYWLGLELVAHACWQDRHQPQLERSQHKPAGNTAIKPNWTAPKTSPNTLHTRIGRAFSFTPTTFQRKQLKNCMEH